MHVEQQSQASLNETSDNDVIALRSCPGTRDMEEMSFDLRGDYLVAVEQATIFMFWEAYFCCCRSSFSFIGA